MTGTDLLQLCLRLGLTPIPLKPYSKEPLVKWGDGWNPTPAKLEVWTSKPDINWGVRCGENLAVLDFDSEEAFHDFIATHYLPHGCPMVKTSRGRHIWVKPKKPIRSKRVGSIEIKCLGSYIVAPPSIHPSGVEYAFVVPPDGTLPEVDLVEFLHRGQIDSSSRCEPYESMRNAAPSDFALRYGKSAYPQSLCGLATKVLTRPDGQVKKLVRLRCWKWDCPKCARLLKRYWLEKLRAIPFGFILRLPDMAKPTTFLRRIGKPGYVHIVANGGSWLFLTDGDTNRVWAEARRAGYDLIAGDVSGDPEPQEVRDCLEQALCLEAQPLNTRRKVTHSRRLFRSQCAGNGCNESKERDGCHQENKHMSGSEEKERPEWATEVAMKPIEEVARELEKEGWRIFWKSEVEAVAFKSKTPKGQDSDIVEMMGVLGIKLRRVGKEYVGLCPFHDDHSPSLTVNREKGVWKCHSTRCGKAGNAEQFVREWRSRQRLQEHRVEG